VWSVTYSPDGKTLASGSGDKTVRPWDVATGKEIRALLGHQDRVMSVTYSPDGKTLASGSEDKTVRLWEVATGRERLNLSGQIGPIYDVIFSPDGKTLASASADYTVLVWDLTGGAAARVPLSESDLESAWKALADPDAALAYQAICRLAAQPARSLPLMEKLLTPVAALPADTVQRLAQWIADLDSPTFAVREKARFELERLGELAIPASREALKGQITLESRQRLEGIIAKQAPQELDPTGERLRGIRAVEVLERAGTLPCLALLRKLSQGAAGARLTREAQGAVQRLERRSK
jgi:hypothetical protein